MPIACGLFATAGALFISTYDTAVVQTLLALAPKFIGPITGIFLLGALTQRGNLCGVVCGAIAGLVTSFLVDAPAIKETVNWLWTGPLSSLATFAVGYFASLVAQNPLRPAAREEDGERI